MLPEARNIQKMKGERWRGSQGMLCRDIGHKEALFAFFLYYAQ